MDVIILVTTKNVLKIHWKTTEYVLVPCCSIGYETVKKSPVDKRIRSGLHTFLQTIVTINRKRVNTYIDMHTLTYNDLDKPK